MESPAPDESGSSRPKPRSEKKSQEKLVVPEYMKTRDQEVNFDIYHKEQYCDPTEAAKNLPAIQPPPRIITPKARSPHVLKASADFGIELSPSPKLSHSKKSISPNSSDKSIPTIASEKGDDLSDNTNEEGPGDPEDWNELFQAILAKDSSNPIQKLKRASQIRSLSLRFVRQATYWAKIILSEIDLHPSLRSIQPINAGGIAGGAKYIHSNIFFKLPDDAHDLYGGETFAMKSVAHEAKGIRAYLFADIRGLHLPLMTTIDYRGRRLLASSLLPIHGSSSLIYGSADGGHVVRNESPELDSLMKQAAVELNLKGHIVGDAQKVTLHSAVDIEGHHGDDGRFYLVDAARVFPPELLRSTIVGVFLNSHSADSAIQPVELSKPTLIQDITRLFNVSGIEKLKSHSLDVGGILYYLSAVTLAPTDRRRKSFSLRDSPPFSVGLVIHQKKGFHLCNMLRPEWVKKSAVPLSSDAYSGFGTHDREIHNAEVRTHTNTLVEEEIPTFARELDQKLLLPVGAGELPAAMQARGINARFLGFLRGHVRYAYTRQIILMEMVCRVAKTILRAKLRAVQSAAESEYKNLIAQYLNLVLGNTPEASEYWHVEMRVFLLLKFDAFGGALSAEEMSEDLRTILSKAQLLQMLQTSLGIKLSAEVLLQAQTDAEFFSRPKLFQAEDIEELVPKTRAIHSDAQIAQLLRKCSFEETTTDGTDRLLAQEKFHAFVRKIYKPKSIPRAASYLQMARVLFELNDLERAMQFTKRAIAIFDHIPAPINLAIAARYQQAEILFAEKQFSACVRLCKPIERLLTNMNIQAHPLYMLSVNLLVDALVAIGGTGVNAQSSDSLMFARKFLAAWRLNSFDGNAYLRKKVFKNPIPTPLVLLTAELGNALSSLLRNEPESKPSVQRWLLQSGQISIEFESEAVLAPTGLDWRAYDDADAEGSNRRRREADYGLLLRGTVSIGDQSEKEEGTLLATLSPCSFFRGKPVLSVAMCGFAAFAVTADFKAYSWGAGTLANGHGHTNRISEPTLISALRSREVIQVACTSQLETLAAFFIDRVGDVYSVGSNTCGKLGHGDTLDRSSVRLIRSLKVEAAIVRIWCGRDHVIARDSQSRLWIWGSNIFGQCGLGEYLPRYCTPMRITEPFDVWTGNVLKVATHKDTVYTLTESGEIFWWGENPFLVQPAGDFLTEPMMCSVCPRKLILPDYIIHRICDIACGKHHLAMLDETGKVRLYGTPSFLGNGSEEGQRSGVPNLDSSTAAYQFSAAQFHTVDIAQKVLQISCSDEYTVAIVSGTESSVADRVVQWGVFGGTRISLPMTVADLRGLDIGAISAFAESWAVFSEPPTFSDYRPRVMSRSPDMKGLSVWVPTGPEAGDLFEIRYECVYSPRDDWIVVTSSKYAPKEEEKVKFQPIHYSCRMPVAKAGRVRFLSPRVALMTELSIWVYREGDANKKELLKTLVVGGNNPLISFVHLLPGGSLWGLMRSLHEQHGHFNCSINESGKSLLHALLRNCGTALDRLSGIQDYCSDLYIDGSVLAEVINSASKDKECILLRWLLCFEGFYEALRLRPQISEIADYNNLTVEHHTWFERLVFYFPAALHYLQPRPEIQHLLNCYTYPKGGPLVGVVPVVASILCPDRCVTQGLSTAEAYAHLLRLGFTNYLPPRLADCEGLSGLPIAYLLLEIFSDPKSDLSTTRDCDPMRWCSLITHGRLEKNYFLPSLKAIAERVDDIDPRFRPKLISHLCQITSFKDTSLLPHIRDIATHLNDVRELTRTLSFWNLITEQDFSLGVEVLTRIKKGDKLAFDEGHTLWHFLTRVRQSQIGSLDRKKFRDTFKLLLQHGASWGRYQLDSVAESFGLTEISELLAEYKNQK